MGTIHSNQQLKLLIIEDNHQNLKYLRDIFCDDLFELYFSVDGQESLRLIKNVKPDIVLLDMFLPTLNGLEILQDPICRSMMKEMTIIVMTSSNEEALQIKALKAGALDYIEKPLNKDVIKQKVFNHSQTLLYKKELAALKEQQEEIIIDRTAQLSNANKKLQQLDALKSEFLAIISHEIRTPLNGLQALQLMDSSKFDEKENEIIEMCRSCSDRLSSFAEKALLMTSLKARGIKNTYISFPIAEIFSNCVQSLHQNNINYISGAQDSDINLFCSPVMMTTAMEEILKNAFSHAKNSVTVGWKKSGSNVVILIQDDGVGFLQKILDCSPHSFITEDIYKHHAGLGLGLYLANTILNLHDGKLSISNNNGACVTIELPVY